MQVTAFWSQLIQPDATSPLFSLPLKLGGRGVGSAVQRLNPHTQSPDTDALCFSAPRLRAHLVQLQTRNTVHIRSSSKTFKTMEDSNENLVVQRHGHEWLLVQEGALRRACASLLQDPPVYPSSNVSARCVSSYFFGHRSEEKHLRALRPIAARAAPDSDADQIRRGLATFPLTSGASPSRMRLSHFE